MPDASWSAPTRRHLPIILIRGFGGLTVEDEKALAYQGFNDGSVYPQKRGENYIYEGLSCACSSTAANTTTRPTWSATLPIR